MMTIFRDAWSSLDKKGRAVVSIVVILAIAGLLALAMWLRYDLSWVGPTIVNITK